MYVFVEFVLVNEVLRDVGELDFYVFGIVEWRREVLVADVVGNELGVFAGEYTSDHKFAKIEGGRFSSVIYGVDDSVAHDGDACAIGVFFLGVELAYDFREGDTFAAVAWDICKSDDAKGVGAFDALSSIGWYFTDTLS